MMRKTVATIMCPVMLLYAVMLHAHTDMTKITKTYERAAQDFSHQVPEADCCFDATMLVNHTL
jgi:hypothetical protein